MTRLALVIAPLLLTACNAPPQQAEDGNALTSAGATEPAAAKTMLPGPGAPPVAASNPSSADRYLGRWTGVEGTYLDVAANGDSVRLTMQHDLDHKGTYDAAVTPEGLRFVRDGKPLTARPSDGAATGLKWLADKHDCLTVQTDEGYCRE